MQFPEPNCVKQSISPVAKYAGWWSLAILLVVLNATGSTRISSGLTVEPAHCFAKCYLADAWQVFAADQLGGISQS